MRFTVRKRQGGGWTVIERATGRRYARANTLRTAWSLMRRHDKHAVRSVVRVLVGIVLALVLFVGVPLLIGAIETANEPWHGLVQQPDGSWQAP